MATTKSLDLPGFKNFTRDNLLRTRAALARSRLGDANMLVACCQDSNGTGHGAGTDGATGYISAGVRNTPFMFSKLMGIAGVPATESTWGTQNLPLTTWATYDPRFSVGSSWSIASGLDPSLGGFMWQNTGAGTPWSFTPQNPYDTVDIYYVGNNAGLSNANVSINGVAQTVLNPNTGTALAKVTYTQALGGGAITITPVSGTFYMVGIEVYNSAKKGVAVRNWSFDGGRATNFTSKGSVWSHLAAVKTMAPHLVFLSLMINDWNTGTNIESYRAMMQSMITSYKQTSDVILATCFPTTTAAVYRTPESLAQYVQVHEDLALANDLPLIDNMARMGGAGTFTNLQTLGLTYNDFHMSAAGYADVAAAYEQAVKVFA